MAKTKKGLADLSSLKVEATQVEAPPAPPLRIADLDRSERIQRAAALISAALGFEVAPAQIEYAPFNLASTTKEGWHYYPIPPESRELVRTARAAADTGTDRFWRVTRPSFQSAFCSPRARVLEDVVIHEHPKVSREEYDTIVDSDDGRDAFSRFNR